ncbi:MAG: acyl-CoA dehydrogenase family protein, partial [Caulobacteraceae bacterium]|nr:acyl-CoA dehydrogenase family protein [Caulobacteraceae bacterium]
LVELDQAGVTRTPLKGIDELRRFALVEFSGAPAEAMDAIDGVEALNKVLDRAAVFEAFEQVGGAQGALEMVRDYVQQRFIFGRPLGSYQAVKHRLADDFAKIELATCNALYAADSLASGKADARAAAATARVGATTAYELIARDNLQFHGGIGFTWEANCQFHYRRARMLALNIGSVEFWSDRLVETLDTTVEDLPRGAPPPKVPEQPDTPEDAEYRAKARAWLAEQAKTFKVGGVHWETPEGVALGKRWTRAKYDAGYSAVDHPKEFGGAGGTRRQRQIFGQEEIRAGLAIPTGGSSMGQAMAAINKHATYEQRCKWETLSYSGEIAWCQLFSEPGAGSDLAAVRTRAVKQGDKWIVNGQKVWTSGGHLSDFGILLARTDPEVSKHQGLSFFIIDMRQPGVTTRPIRQINGQTGFTETFFVDAEIPDEYRLDAVGNGWAVAMSVLAVERTTTKGISEGDRRSSNTSARNLIRLAKAARRGRGTAYDSAVVRSKIAQFHMEAQGIKNFTLRLQEDLKRGGPPPLNLPVIKLTATNRIQQVQAFMMDLDEAGGIVQSADAPASEDRFYDYLTSASSRIAGGADEVLRNQLAERALGLPGDMRADKDVPFNKIPA